jgi:hypothetical protein
MPVPDNLTYLSQYGGRLARVEIMPAVNADGTFNLDPSQFDATVASLRAMRLRLYPMLGLNHSPKFPGSSLAFCDMDPEKDKVRLAAWTTSFARRYGRGGSFWTENPTGPYLPITAYEIGNEVNGGSLYGVGDETCIHYFDQAGNPDPYAYDRVYQYTKNALHAVDPNAIAVAGSLVPVWPHTALDPLVSFVRGLGPMDAIGWHPYLFDDWIMKRETLALRAILAQNGKGDVPIDANEWGFNVPGAETWGLPVLTQTEWGRHAAEYTRSSLCQPHLNVHRVQVEWWGGRKNADKNTIYPVVHDDGTLTDFGIRYLDELKTLTTSGCAPPPEQTCGDGILYEYYSPSGHDHVYTATLDDQTMASYGYQRTPNQSYVFTGQSGLPTGTVALNEYMDFGAGKHFYTTNPGDPAIGEASFSRVVAYVYQPMLDKPNGVGTLYRWRNEPMKDVYLATSASQSLAEVVSRLGYHFESVEAYVPTCGK